MIEVKFFVIGYYTSLYNNNIILIISHKNGVRRSLIVGAPIITHKVETVFVILIHLCVMPKTPILTHISKDWLIQFVSLYTPWNKKKKKKVQNLLTSLWNWVIIKLYLKIRRKNNIGKSIQSNSFSFRRLDSY